MNTKSFVLISLLLFELKSDKQLVSNVSGFILDNLFLNCVFAKYALYIVGLCPPPPVTCRLVTKCSNVEVSPLATSIY